MKINILAPVETGRSRPRIHVALSKDDFTTIINRIDYNADLRRELLNAPNATVVLSFDHGKEPIMVGSSSRGLLRY